MWYEKSIQCCGSSSSTFLLLYGSGMIFGCNEEGGFDLVSTILLCGQLLQWPSDDPSPKKWKISLHFLTFPLIIWLQIYLMIMIFSFQVLHGDHPLPGDMTTCIQEVQTRCHSLPGVPHAAYHHRFSHLVGYGARYYSYMMARLEIIYYKTEKTS